MRFVVPVSQSDVHLLSKRVEVFKRLGGWKNHQLTFAPTPSCAGEAQKAVDDLKDICPAVDSHPVLRDSSGGWPEACNKHFYDTVVMLQRMQNTSNWFFFELDCTPLRPGWQDALETAYNAGGKPYCGHVRATSEVTNPPLKGSHMVGAGMYPHNFHVLAEAEYKAIPRNLPFDISLRWAMMRDGVLNTNLIAHRHSTKNYRLEGGVLVTDGQDSVDIVSTAVLHGCKDDSVADIVLFGDLDTFGPVMRSAPEAVKEAPIVVKEVPKPTLEAQLLAGGYRTPMKGVWVHMSVSNEEVAVHFAPTEPKVEAPAPKRPMTAMDYAIAAAKADLEAQPISPEVQHATQGEPVGGLTEPLETLDTSAGENLPEPGADNVAPPFHTPIEDGGSQGESSETDSPVAPSGSDPQTGHLSILDDLTLQVARSKPKRIGDWASQLQVSREELTKLINGNPSSGLSIARAGWVTLAAA